MSNVTNLTYCIANDTNTNEQQYFELNNHLELFGFDVSYEIFGPNSPYVSIGFVLLAVVFSVLGGILQQLARRGSRNRSYCPRPLSKHKCILMTTGLFSTILAVFLDLSALIFGNITLVAPLGVLKRVFMVLVEASYHKEKISPLNWLCTACLLTGCGGAVYFSVPRNCIFSLPDLRELFLRSDVEIYTASVAVLVGVTLVLHLIFTNCEKRNGTDSRMYRNVLPIHRNLYPFAAGMFGAQGVLFGKALVEIITNYIVFSDA